VAKANGHVADLVAQLEKSGFDKDKYETEVADLRMRLGKVVNNVDMATKGRKMAEDS
jgi:hypothetical protein